MVLDARGAHVLLTGEAQCHFVPQLASVQVCSVAVFAVRRLAVAASHYWHMVRANVAGATVHKTAVVAHCHFIFTAAAFAVEALLAALSTDLCEAPFTRDSVCAIVTKAPVALAAVANITTVGTVHRVACAVEKVAAI